MERSCIPQFYKLSVAERVRKVRDKGLISSSDFKSLASGDHTLDVDGADKMIENVIGVMGLPVGLGLNFLVNGKDYVVPMVVEEPSIVAALSSAAKLVRRNGGFVTESDQSLLIGQIQLVNVEDPQAAKTELLDQKEEILTLANGMHPRMVSRGGGACDLEVFIHPCSDAIGHMVVVHILVDTKDAMGANAINSMCEGIAPLIERIAGGKVFLRILSNLTDRALVRARCTIPVEHLAGKGFTGEEVRDGILIASEFAEVDPYRAATHNKGIMNGIDAVALATGNDWRALEAGAHAFAAANGQYTSLTRWTKNANGDLEGEIEVPIKVGIVGGPLESNPTVAVNLRMLSVESAQELAEVMAAAGLAQNFSAIRALATDGIQKGHMTLHARSVASAAGASPEVFDLVVENLIETGEIKIWKAKELIQSIEAKGIERSKDDLAADRDGFATAHAKVILLGEHSVVYGRHALAAPIPLAVQARIKECEKGLHLLIPRWDVEHRLHRHPKERQSFEKPAAKILETLGLLDRNMIIEVYPNVPRAMGLGSSAAVAVAIVRALDQHFGLGLGDQEVSDLAFEAEKIAHGTPSGIDNTLATFGEAILFKRGDQPLMTPIEIATPLDLVIGISGVRSLTAKTVADVRRAWELNPALYERIFDEIDRITLSAVEAIATGDLPQLGQLMNVCHGQLNALQVSSWELEELVQIARGSGALGAKLTGGGGGGSMVALANGNSSQIAEAIRAAGFEAMEVRVGE